MREVYIRALESRSEVLYGLGRTKEAITSFEPVIRVIGSEVNKPSVDSATLMEAAKAYDLLGDELGEPETPSLGDYSGAMIAYRRAGELYLRAGSKDHNSMSSQKEIALNRLKVGCVQMLADPASAIKSIRESLLLWSQIPSSAMSLEDHRTRLYSVIRLGDALTRARRYDEALETYLQAERAVRQSASWDEHDTRAEADLAAIYGDQADIFIDMLDPVLDRAGTANRERNMQRAVELLRQSILATERITVSDPNNPEWASYLGYERVRLGTLLNGLGRTREGEESAIAGLTSLLQIASQQGASGETLNHAARALLTAKPMRLRNPQLSVRYAERLVSNTSRKDPNCLLLLAEAYQASGNAQASKVIAKEGLDLLPEKTAGVPDGRCRTLLEHVLQAIK